ncbi:ester cyclase [Candidatus Solirubrobacter pratensis]|uniref:ester cyclase n=1 Tax=Candidatus Solirubrobacter pratensis TaxID=1298857 RepID=UPI0004885605|nr:ester cyclase [Candidatus Solirubrobacter pratensis]
MDVDALFDAWDRAWSGRDARAFESLCDPDVHYEDPLTEDPLVGTDALGRHARGLWEAFPDARVNSTGARVADGAFACAPCRVLGTHEGRLGRIAPTHRELSVHAIVYAELRDERLLRVRAFFDVYGAGMQLGALPKHGTAGERALLLLRGFGLRG